MSLPSWMIYGAYGFTGKLLVEEALRRGHKPILAGRSEEKLRKVAEEKKLEWRSFDLEDHREICRHLEEVELVFHAAGPFVFTSHPMIRACLETSTHYLDITGEIPVFENTFSHDQEAREKGILLMSGAGADVVPTDCLARYTADKLEDASQLTLCVYSDGEASAGTLKTMVELLPRGTVVRRDGEFVPQRTGAGTRQFAFPFGKARGIPVPWGDVSTAYRSTKIPHISVYMTFPPPVLYFLRLGGPLLRHLMGIKFLRRSLQKWIEKTVTGPDEKLQKEGVTWFFCQVENERGERRESWLKAGEGYVGTAYWGVESVEATFRCQPAGALTPSLAFGSDFVLNWDKAQIFDSLL